LAAASYSSTLWPFIANIKPPKIDNSKTTMSATTPTTTTIHCLTDASHAVFDSFFPMKSCCSQQHYGTIKCQILTMAKCTVSIGIPIIKFQNDFLNIVWVIVAQ